MESRAAGAVVVGEGVSDEAARLAAQYGDEAARLAAQYGDDVLRLVEQYVDEGLQVLETHGRPAVALLDDFGEQALEVLRRAVPDTSRPSWEDFIPRNYEEQVVGAFDGPGYAVRLQEDLIVYRYWGDDLGTNLWFTTNPNLSPAEARALLALPNRNTAIHVTEFRIPKGTTIIIYYWQSSWSGDSRLGRAVCCRRWISDLPA